MTLLPRMVPRRNYSRVTGQRKGGQQHLRHRENSAELTHVSCRTGYAASKSQGVSHIRRRTETISSSLYNADGLASFSTYERRATRICRSRRRLRATVLSLNWSHLGTETLRSTTRPRPHRRNRPPPPPQMAAPDRRRAEAHLPKNPVLRHHPLAAGDRPSEARRDRAADEGGQAEAAVGKFRHGFQLGSRMRDGSRRPRPRDRQAKIKDLFKLLEDGTFRRRQTRNGRASRLDRRTAPDIVGGRGLPVELRARWRTRPRSEAHRESRRSPAPAFAGARKSIDAASPLR